MYGSLYINCIPSIFIAQYNLWIGDYREADRLYNKYENQIEKFEWEEPVLRMQALNSYFYLKFNT